ncbi:zinc metallochaperone AztD [Pseudonocardia nematodicida]|uniref:Zinc metallochaperone AztD n=1 Tax=Pseudonocardia nematodicida TaxID=1206997 RepID=A0ABV1KGH3_9PSEU
MTSRTRPRRRTAVALSSLTVAALALSACGTGGAAEPAPASVTDPIALTHDGGIYVLDGGTLELRSEIELPGFNRLNAVADGRHAMVSTSTGFRVLDMGAGALTDVEYPAPTPGHVVNHHGRTALFADGTGEVTMLDSDAVLDGPDAADTYTTPEAHHGVAVELADGSLVTTLGNEEERPGIVALDAARNEITRNEDCPGVHGEATARGEAVVIGCETGVLIYRDGAITKVDSPTPYGRIGNQAGSDVSPVTLGDYKQDEAAELERPTQVSLIDTETNRLQLVDLGTSYTFRSLSRGPEGEALVLGTDGSIHEIDPAAGSVIRTIPVIEAWEEPLDWQQARPALFVRGGTAYVTEPGANAVHAVDLAAGEVTNSATLPATPNEITGASA